jgi:hypothetical protein
MSVMRQTRVVRATVPSVVVLSSSGLFNTNKYVMVDQRPNDVMSGGQASVTQQLILSAI